MVPALLALEDGSLFKGESVGVEGTSVGEVVFNTAMTGYQEILTDPSYSNQIITFTYPQIGNTGINLEDMESDRIWASGMVIKQLPRLASSWRMHETLHEFLCKQNVVGITNVDTRRLTKVIREKGALAGCIMSGQRIDEHASVANAKAFPGLAGMDLAREVCCHKPYSWEEAAWSLSGGYGKIDETRYKIVAFDFGIKRNILRLLRERGCEILVVPATTSAKEVLEYKPDGIFLSNGPGDPEPCDYAIAAIKELLDARLPIFGICLGHQLLSLASGAKTIKMTHGHHGANHPVKDLRSEQVLITSQNHGFAVDANSLPSCLVPTHVSLFDGTLQGVRHKDFPAFGFQGHPEASPGPQDCEYLFDEFINLMGREGA